MSFFILDRLGLRKGSWRSYYLVKLSDYIKDKPTVRYNRVLDLYSR